MSSSNGRFLYFEGGFCEFCIADHYGANCAIFAHVALGSWILARRELHAACLFVGSVLNTALCVAIKTQARGSAWVQG